MLNNQNAAEPSNHQLVMAANEWNVAAQLRTIIIYNCILQRLDTYLSPEVFVTRVKMESSNVVLVEGFVVLVY